ncbi:helix-turn-helix domain-containing protein [Streptomyces sp. NPDC053755]|uniref:TetR/AcrR family transcriptional regulator n=1 Tax=Streptomyces sp. NPDC053755 TaxID=3155815 RepID=UPI003447620B
MGTEMGLRESKKQETRRLISDHATRLFMEQGFEATTIAEIADAARVAKKTVTNYFARKEDMALDHHEAFTASLAAAVAGRGDGESPLDALRRECLTALEHHDPVAGFAGPAFAGMIVDSPTLTARLRELHDRREDELATALAALDTEAGAGERPGAGGDLAPRAAAALIAAAHRLLFRRIQELTLAGDPDDRITAVLVPEAEHVFDLLAAALDGSWYAGRR